MGKREALQEILGSGTCPRGKQVVETRRTQPDVGGQSGEIRLLGAVCFQKADGLRDALVITHAGSLPRVWSLAHPVLAGYTEYQKLLAKWVEFWRKEEAYAKDAKFARRARR